MVGDRDPQRIAVDVRINAGSGLDQQLLAIASDIQNEHGYRGIERRFHEGGLASGGRDLRDANPPVPELGEIDMAAVGANLADFLAGVVGELTGSHDPEGIGRAEKGQKEQGQG